MKKPVMYEKLGRDPQWVQKLLFAGVFIQENMLHAVFDRYSIISSKQWLLLVVAAAFDTPPDLTRLGEAMGCSRQNVKKLAQALEKDNYVSLEKSETDFRALHVHLTDRGKALTREMEAMAEDVHSALFSEFSDEEIQQYYQYSIKLMHGIHHLETYFIRQEALQNSKK